MIQLISDSSGHHSRGRFRFGNAARWALAVVALACGPQAARAQQVLVQADVAEDTLGNTFGPNRSYYGHLYLGYGLLAGPASSGAGVRYGLPSAELRAGGRLKFRLNQVLSLNLDLGYAYQHYGLAQNGQKTLPTAALHRRESLGLQQVYSEVSLRLTAGRRGNAIGRYLDLLASGGWVATTSHVTEDEPAPGIGFVETTERGLPYLRRWTSGLGARFGIDRYALVGRYRLSSVFGSAYSAWPELPRWVLGVEVGLF